MSNIIDFKKSTEELKKKQEKIKREKIIQKIIEHAKSLKWDKEEK